MAYNGPLPQVVNAGGTGRATLTNHGVLVGAGTTAVTQLVAGSAGQALLSGGASADPAYSTPTYPSASGSAGQILRSDGTNNVYTTSTYPNTNAINTLLYASSANVMAALATGNNGVLITSAGGIPSWLADGTTGQVLTATTGSPPSWASPATSGTVTTVSVVSANGFAGTVANATTTPAITISTSITGVLSGNGTAISGSAVTQYDVLVGGASNAISSVGPGSAGQVLQSGGNAANPAYTTATYPATATGTGKVLIADGTNWVASTPTFPNASATSGKFIRSDGTNWIASTPTLPTSAGTSGKVLQSDGTNYVESTPTYPSTSGGAGVILRSDGTNNVYTTATYPATTGANTMLISTSANIITTTTYITGTWTPAISFGGSTTGITYSTQGGQYTQIGNLVIAVFRLTLSSKGAQVGSVLLTGLPVSLGGNGSTMNSIIAFANTTLTALYTGITLLGNTSATNANLFMYGSAQGYSQMSNTQFSNTSDLIGTFVYTTA